MIIVPPCSLGLSATSQQYFSLTTNQPPAISQQYSSLRTNQHQPTATSQPNTLDNAALRRYHGAMLCHAQMYASDGAGQTKGRSGPNNKV
jgi:hypothetical protein